MIMLRKNVGWKINPINELQKINFANLIKLHVLHISDILKMKTKVFFKRTFVFVSEEFRAKIIRSRPDSKFQYRYRT